MSNAHMNYVQFMIDSLDSKPNGTRLMFESRVDVHVEKVNGKWMIKAVGGGSFIPEEFVSAATLARLYPIDDQG